MMNTIKLLAFSSSRVGTLGYLEAAAPVIEKFLAGANYRIGFVPFASVDNDYEAYTDKVREGLSALHCSIETVTPQNAQQVISESDAIMIGGGNTFKLIHDLYAYNLLDTVKTKVQQGTPYIGWSAGSNLTGATICTTNDMPVIQPLSFNAFGFLSFQINPHYHNVVMKGFNGETRDQRLEEFLKLNTDRKIVCLPEGTYLQLQNGELLFDGITQGVVMSREDGQTIHQIIDAGSLISHLL